MNNKNIVKVENKNIEYDLFRAVVMILKQSDVGLEDIDQTIKYVRDYVGIMKCYRARNDYFRNLEKEEEVSQDMFQKYRACLTISEHIQVMEAIASGLKSKNIYSEDIGCWFTGLSFGREVVNLMRCNLSV